MRLSLRNVKLKHLSQSGVWPSGNARLYYRPKGQKGVAMPDLPQDHPKFLAAYAKAAGVKPEAPVIEGSIASAIAAYKASDAFLIGLKASTRSVRRRMLDDIAERYGFGRVRDLATKHIQKDLDRLSGHPANNRLRAWRGLCAWLKDANKVASDPSDGIKRKKVAKSDGHVPWEREDVLKFRECWPIGTVERLAFELIHWTGARVSDVIRMGEGNTDREGWLTFKQEKTGGEVYIPFKRELPDFALGMAEDLKVLHQAIAARNDRHLTYITTFKGAARSSKSVSQWFAAKSRKAGITGKTAHGLRKTRTIALVEVEATTHQIGAWTGHESLKEIEHYAKKFNKRKALSGSKGERQSSNSPDKVPTFAVKSREIKCL